MLHYFLRCLIFSLMEQRTETFRAWRRRMRLSQILAAKALGRSPRQMRAYDHGEQEVPRTVRMAMRAFEEHPDEYMVEVASGEPLTMEATDG
jgi:hypothetical protein